MAVTIVLELPEELMRELSDRASRRGVSVEEELLAILQEELQSETEALAGTHA